MALFGASLAALQAPRASATPQGKRGSRRASPWARNPTLSRQGGAPSACSAANAAPRQHGAADMLWSCCTTTQTCCRRERCRCSAPFGGCHHREQRELWPPSSDRGAPILLENAAVPDRAAWDGARARSICGHSPCDSEPCGVMAGAASACTLSSALADAC